MDAYETSIYTAVVITCLFVFCLALFFVLSVFRHERRFIALQRRSLLDEAGLLEKERTRVARDLHDELAPLLSLAKLQLNNVAAPEEDQIFVRKACQNLETVMLRMGDIAANLNASKLVQKGLRFALHDFLEDIGHLAAPEVVFEYAVQQEIKPETGIHLYRIAQEIVHNSLKHSAATKVEVRINEGPGTLFLFFSDNGKGFNATNSHSEGPGIGLASIRSRTTLLGGRLRCQSEAGTGTRYFIEFPLKDMPYD